MNADVIADDNLLSLLTKHDELINSWQKWSDVLGREVNNVKGTVLLASLVGAQSQVPSYAFAAGYQCALKALLPQLDVNKRYAFCVTEEAGNTAKVIETKLEQQEKNYFLTGNKKFITGAAQADNLLVIAHAGMRDDGKKLLKLVDVPKLAAGIEIELMNELQFIPELSHGRVSLNNVAVAEGHIFPGDAYEDYVKPFRTIEDIHVSAALLGHLVGLGVRFEWPKNLLEKFLSVIASFQFLASENAKLAGVHIALGGAFQLRGDLIEQATPWLEKLPQEEKAIWQRDRVLLGIAGKAAEKRLANAWQKIVS